MTHMNMIHKKSVSYPKKYEMVVLIQIPFHEIYLNFIFVFISEYIEMDEIDDESQETVDNTQTEASELNDDQNNITILLHNSKKAQKSSTNSADNTIQMVKMPKVIETPAPKRMSLLKKNYSRLEKHPPTDDNNEIELEVDLIVMDEKKTDQTIESNENGETSTNRKRLRLEVEPLINISNESSPTVEKEIKSPAVPEHTNLTQVQPQPRKSIEDIVSSSEAFDTNSEDKYFALSILGTLRRLTPHKRALAKCHILSYLTEIEYGNSNTTT